MLVPYICRRTICQVRRTLEATLDSLCDDVSLLSAEFAAHARFWRTPPPSDHSSGAPADAAVELGHLQRAAERLKDAEAKLSHFLRGGGAPLPPWALVLVHRGLSTLLSLQDCCGRALPRNARWKQPRQTQMNEPWATPPSTPVARTQLRGALGLRGRDALWFGYNKVHAEDCDD
jgi:hypothetical protein